MTRRCSHCAQQNHNSRTCPERGVRLFGVRIHDQGAGEMSESMRKSVSMGNLSNYSGATVDAADPGDEDRGNAAADGYLSDGLVHGARDRKRGIPWTEEEHRLFLLGLQKLGKGDWRGISRTYVQSRTPTQVASHAQKYFIRQSNMNKRKRRSSLFDLVTDLTPSISAPNLRSSASSDDIRSPGMPPLSPNPAAPSFGPPATFFDPTRKQSNFPLPSSSYPPPQFHFPNFPPPVSHGRLATSYSTPNHFPANIPFSPPNYISPGFGGSLVHPPMLARHSTYPQFPLPPVQMTSSNGMTNGMTSGLTRQQQMAAVTEMVRATSYERLHDLGGASNSEQRTEVTKPIPHKASPSHPPPQPQPPHELDEKLRDADPTAQQASQHSFASPPFHNFSHLPWFSMGPFAYGMMQNGLSGAVNQTSSKVCRPTASHPSAPLDIPGCSGRGEDAQAPGEGASPSLLEPSPLSARLLGEGPLRHSAFQSKLSYKNGGMSNGDGNSVIGVV
ncbi:Myb domain protein [Klebsormidium nitens]|uniref:Myb domain protein n=1 Tax=Klebsormidium nitens TaxID=105231 RepID=A0A1Y1HWX0_KLENI|nr:Myb domain protein [Klebsormidium nitens]|eukprot:GAQ83135.1 Myb domain protein [Klebsormidium nitens]